MTGLKHITALDKPKIKERKTSLCTDGCGFRLPGTLPRRCSECSLKHMETYKKEYKDKRIKKNK